MSDRVWKVSWLRVSSFKKSTDNCTQVGARWAQLTMTWSLIGQLNWILSSDWLIWSPLSCQSVTDHHSYKYPCILLPSYLIHFLSIIIQVQLCHQLYQFYRQIRYRKELLDYYLITIDQRFFFSKLKEQAYIYLFYDHFIVIIQKVY